MKKLSTLLLAVLFLTLSSIPAFAAEQMAFLVSANTDTLAVGEVLEYTITLDTPAELSGIDCTLALNENFKVVGLQAGDIDQSELSCNEVNGEFIFLYMDGGLSSPAKTGEVLCTIQLKATAPCADVLPIACTAANGAAIIDNTVASLSVKMDAVSPVTVTEAVAPTAAPTAAPANSSASSESAAPTTAPAADEPFVMLDGEKLNKEEVDALTESEATPVRTTAPDTLERPEPTGEGGNTATSDDASSTADSNDTSSDANSTASSESNADSAASQETAADPADTADSGNNTTVLSIAAVAILAVIGGAVGVVAYRRKKKTQK